MKDDQNRVLLSDWNSRIKNYVSLDPGDKGQYTPKFGYVVDSLRINYNIYVDTTPMTNGELDKEGDEYPQRVFNFRGTAIKIKGATVEKSSSVSDISFTGAMRKAINRAIDFLES